MSRSLQFHLDEHIHGAVAAGLRRHGIDVTTAADAGLLGATDPDQAAFALRTGRVLVTHDRDFARLASQGLEHSGFIICHQKNLQIGKIIDAIVLIWELADAQGMKNYIEWVH
jgi:predicted nuclease of predicted toxin-antitoxin system